MLEHMMMMQAMKGGGKGKKGGWPGGDGGGWKGGGAWKGGGGNGWGGGGGGSSWGIEGVDEALTEALAPFAQMDPECGTPQLVQKISQKVQKAATKFEKDERISQRGNSGADARVVIEDFCTQVMSAISASCYERLWWTQVDLIEPLSAAVDHVFKGKKVCARLVYPMMRSIVEEAVFRYREDERIDKQFWQAVEITATNESYRKKCVQALQKSYDEAFQKAPYGRFPTEPPGLGLIQDFVYGWMQDFANRAHDILSNGAPNGETTEGQLQHLVMLFQVLCDPAPGSCCIPFDLVNQVESVPPAPWSFIQEAAASIYTVQAAPAAKKFKGGGKGMMMMW